MPETRVFFWNARSLRTFFKHINRIVTQLSQKRRVLITGSGGRLGRLLQAAHRLTESTGDAMQTEILFQSRQIGADLVWTPGDDPSRLPPFDAVVALWGRTKGNRLELAENETLVDVGCALAKQLGATQLIHISSVAVYGAGCNMTESHPCQPLNAYGAAKCGMEARVEARDATDALSHTVLRLANVVGADSLAPALEGPDAVSLHRFDNGTGPVRSYLSASDLLTVLNRLVSDTAGDPPSVLNVASPAPVAMQALAEAAGKDVQWHPAPADAIQNVTVNVAELHHALEPLEMARDATAMIADWRKLTGGT